MTTPISSQAKREFIRYFFKRYQMKMREAIWILEYLMNREDLIENIHFVRQASHCPKGLLIAAKCSNVVGIRYIEDRSTFINAEKILGQLRRLEKGDSLYIELAFADSHCNPRYAAILEENPFSPGPGPDVEKFVARFLEELTRKIQQEKWEQEMNDALDARDEDLFHQLCEQRKTLSVATQE